MYNKELKKINRFCNSNATPGHLDAFSSMIEKSAIMIQVAAMIDENPRTKPINSQTRILFSKPLSYPESPLRSTELIMMKLIVPRIPHKWWAKFTPPPCSVEASMMNHQPTKNRIAETSTAMAFREEVPVNQMHELKASIIDMAAELVWMGRK